MTMLYRKGMLAAVLFSLALLAAGTASAQQRYAENTATIEPPFGVTDPDPSNNSATDRDPIQEVADLNVTKINPHESLMVGMTTSYTIVVTNGGPSGADGAVLADDWTTEPWLDCSAGPVSCAASGAAGTTCPAPAALTPAALLDGIEIPGLPNGGVVTVTLQCLVVQPPP